MSWTDKANGLPAIPMKSVLCYGDSNTWGSATGSRAGARYSADERWPGVLRVELGDGWTVVTKDRQPSAQWEHTILVTADGYDVLTRRPGEDI